MQLAMLPIYEKEQAVIDAVRQHRVVVVEGPAGTGKTTQLPRMLSRAGLVPRCMGITQPRRIAAVSVAWRIAQEEQVTIGDKVGYAIRFDDATSPATRIKVMTDGILLQEARHDPLLSAYDVLMVDEAHERSLNIDFTLGLLHRVLKRRSDLKVVISSATLHPGHFQRFFGAVAGEVPVVSIENRTYPVRIEYQPLTGGGAPAAVAEDVVDTVVRMHPTLTGHVLVFLPGEGLITRVEQGLKARRLPGILVLPLYGRLTRQEQERVFEEFGTQKKIILATNIAETSITIENVQSVIDCGLAKLPWFNAHTGVTTLREEPVSQASAIQRAGRAGRTGPGTVVRMYDEASWERRPRYTPEEILRIDLSEAVLRLISLGVRDVEGFEFPTPPPVGKLRAALASLKAMGAIDAERNLTDVGRQMVPFPLSPPLARMVVEAAHRFPTATRDVLLVGAFLSVRSPFTFPSGEEEQARTAQANLAHPLGDAVTAVQTFHKWHKAQDKAAFCRKNYLDADTMTFIDRAHRQLVDIAEQHGVQIDSKAADPTEVVRCLACGFADKVLVRRGFAFDTLTDLTVAVHPSSSLYNSRTRFAVAAELMSSGRTYAFNVSALEPAWLAEANPEAARMWQAVPRSGRLRETPRQVTPKHPPFIVLNGVQLPVAGHGRRPTVDIPLQAVSELQRVSLASLPEDSRRWRARVISPYGVLARDGLRELLALIPHLPWPAPEATTKAQAPIGALLEPDRNLHTLGRHFSQLLQPLLGPQVPQAGWLALVSNGAGGFWYDVMPDYVEAAQASLAALEDLDEAGPATEALQPQLRDRMVQLESINSVLAAARQAAV
jgi:HrpA-like RNA helicase